MIQQRNNLKVELDFMFTSFVKVNRNVNLEQFALVFIYRKKHSLTDST
jgi:hypothetical protein